MRGQGHSASFDGAAADLVSRMAPSVVEMRAGSGIGAGTVWHPSGIIVTNDHVVPSDRVMVGLADGRRAMGQVIARDRHNDLAVVHVGLGGLPALEPRLHPVRTGEVVLALGHPFGVRHAAALGIVSATTTTFEGSDRLLIRADVPIGPGSSGGPLVDAFGRVVGIAAMVGGGMALAVPGSLADGLVRAALAAQAA